MGENHTTRAIVHRAAHAAMSVSSMTAHPATPAADQSPATETGDGVTALIGALSHAHDLLQQMTYQRECPDPEHADDVRLLGERIGYGAMMASATALWPHKLADDGCAGGEFVTGLCRTTIERGVRRLEEALAEWHSLATKDAPDQSLPVGGGDLEKRYLPGVAYYAEQDALEFVERDVPTVARDAGAGVEWLLDMDSRQIIGFRVYAPRFALSSPAPSGEYVLVPRGKAETARDTLLAAGFPVSAGYLSTALSASPVQVGVGEINNGPSRDHAPAISSALEDALAAKLTAHLFNNGLKIPVDDILADLMADIIPALRASGGRLRSGSSDEAPPANHDAQPLVAEENEAAPLSSAKQVLDDKSRDEQKPTDVEVGKVGELIADIDAEMAGVGRGYADRRGELLFRCRDALSVPPLGGVVEALRRVREAIENDPDEVVTDVLWVGPGETAVDCLTGLIELFGSDVFEKSQHARAALSKVGAT